MDPDVQLAQANFELAKAEKKRVRSQFFPKLYATFNLYATKPDLIVEPDNEFALHYLVTAHLEFPIFDGLRNIHQYHKAAMLEKMALIGKEEADRNAQMKERSRTRSESTEIIPLKGPKMTLEEARKTYDVAKVAKRTGFISSAEYMGAEKYWAKSRLDYAKAQLQWLIDQVDRE
jgi:outer membrane protein TolC